MIPSTETNFETELAVGIGTNETEIILSGALPSVTSNGILTIDKGNKNFEIILYARISVENNSLTGVTRALPWSGTSLETDETLRQSHPARAVVAGTTTHYIYELIKSMAEENIANRFLQSFCFDKTTDVTVGSGRSYFKIPAKFNGDSLSIANASLIEAGIGGNVTIQLEMTPPEVSFGDSSTRFDITNPSGTTFRYTYDGTGTDPDISDSDESVLVDDEIHIKTENFNSSNNGIYVVTAVGAGFFEITNSSGVVESDKTIGAGAIQRRRWVDVLSTPISIESGELSGDGVVDGTKSRLETGAILRVDVVSTCTEEPLGLIVNTEANG